MVSWWAHLCCCQDCKLYCASLLRFSVNYPTLMMPGPALLPVTGSEAKDCHSLQQMTDDSWVRSSVNMVYSRPYLWPRGILYFMVLPWKRSVFISIAQVTSKSKVDVWHLSCHNPLTCWNMRVMLSLPTMDNDIWVWAIDKHNIWVQDPTAAWICIDAAVPCWHQGTCVTQDQLFMAMLMSESYVTASTRQTWVTWASITLYGP